jgi:hypothetical protein
MIDCLFQQTEVILEVVSSHSINLLGRQTVTQSKVVFAAVRITLLGRQTVTQSKVVFAAVNISLLGRQTVTQSTVVFAAVSITPQGSVISFPLPAQIRSTYCHRLLVLHCAKLRTDGDPMPRPVQCINHGQVVEGQVTK